MLGKIEGRRKGGQQRLRWLDGITDMTDMSLSKLWERLRGRKAKRMCWSEQTHFSNNTKDDLIQGHHQTINREVRLIIFFCSQKWRSSIQSSRTKLGADCASDHEILIDKFKLKFKYIGKTIRPFRCDLNQILYNYTVK